MTRDVILAAFAITTLGLVFGAVPIYCLVWSADLLGRLKRRVSHPHELVFRDDQLVMNYFGSKPHEAGKMRETLRKGRDALFLQSEKDRRHYRSQGMGEPRCAAEFFAVLFNRALAEPFQLSDVQVILQMDRNRTLKKAELQSRLAAAWEGLDLPKDLANRISPLMAPGVAVPDVKPQRYRRLS